MSLDKKLIEIETKAEKFSKNQEGNYSLNIKDYINVGDSVIFAIPTMESGNRSSVSRFTIGKVIFVGSNFATIEVECTDPTSGKIKVYSDSGKNAYKLRYTIDSNDIFNGAVKKGKVNEVTGTVSPEYGFNTLQLNSLIRKGVRIFRNNIKYYCANYEELAEVG